MLSVKEYFKQQKIVLPDAVLMEIEAQCRAAGNGNNKVAALELFKNTDIRTWFSGKSCQTCLQKFVLPKKNPKVYTVSEPLILQIDHLRDISKPAYQQLLKAVNRYGENVLVSADPEDFKKGEENGNRMLLINFTDGETDIQGMEYHCIPVLNTSTSPGTKVLLIPPLIVRKGMLLLKAANVHVIGGIVPALCSKFSEKNILAASLPNTDPVALLASLEKSRPCPPPGLATNRPVNGPRSLSTAATTTNNNVPANDRRNQFFHNAPTQMGNTIGGLMDDDDDDFLSNALAEYESHNMDNNEDDFLSQALDEYESHNATSVIP